MMRRMLTDADIDRFREHGVVALRGAIPRAMAERVVEVLTPELDATSDAPVQRIVATTHPDVVATANVPALRDAFDRLVGPGRWRPVLGMGSFPVRFPSEVDPGDAGWHVDGAFPGADGYRVNHRSDGRALLFLPLYTDVGPDDAPTRLRLASHRIVADVLEAFGDEGLGFMDLAGRAVPATEHCPVAQATGEAGDVFLCHPFLVHAASWPHRGAGPRWIGQQCLPPGPGYDVRALGCR
jgi:hypothetical protein